MMDDTHLLLAHRVLMKHFLKACDAIIGTAIIYKDKFYIVISL